MLAEKDHVMVVSTSPFVPHPGPAERPARMGLPALTLLLAAGLLHTQVSKRGWKLWEMRVGLSCKGSGGTALGYALLSSSLLFLLWLLSCCSPCPAPMSHSCCQLPACPPSTHPQQHPSPEMPPAQTQDV